MRGPILVHARQQLILDCSDDRVDLGLVELLLAGVRPDMGRIREEDPSRDEVVRLRLVDDVVKNLFEDIRPGEPSPVGLADRRMIRDLLVHPEPEEPSVREIRLDLFDGLADGPDVEERAEKDDLDEDLWVDAGLPGVRIERRAQAVDDGEVDMAVDLADEMVFRDQLVQRGRGVDRFMALGDVGSVHDDSPSCSEAVAVHTYRFPFSSVRRPCRGFFFGRRGLRKRQTAARWRPFASLVRWRPDSCRKAIQRRPSSDASRDAAPGLPAESVGAGRTSDSIDVSQQAESPRGDSFCVQR